MLSCTVFDFVVAFMHFPDSEGCREGFGTSSVFESESKSEELDESDKLDESSDESELEDELDEGSEDVDARRLRF